MDITEESIKWLLVQRGLGFLYVSTAVCVLYDHLTTLSDEVVSVILVILPETYCMVGIKIELVWNRPRWSTVQFLYMTNRYIGNAFQIYSAYAFTKFIVTGSNKVCPTYHIVAGYFLSFASLSMHGIMIFRVSSMYSHNRRIIALLGGALFIECIVVLVIQLASYAARVPVPNPAPGVLMCAQKSFPPWMYILWFPVIFFETLIFGLSLSLAMVYYKSLRHMANLDGAPLKSYFHHLDSLAYILLRDSITFPFLAVTVCIINLIVWYHLPHLCIQIAFALAGLTPCILGPRLVLNLRDAYYQPFNRECCTGVEGLAMDLDIGDDDNGAVDGLCLVADSNSNSRRRR